MSGQNDSDIEKLTDYLHGIPVKEEIRKLFKSKGNGTPDNISKAGCLALAMRSNELGKEQGLGHILWNTWRKAFPVCELQNPHPPTSLSDEYLMRYRYKNCADFSNFNHEQSGIGISSVLIGDFAFKDFEFGPYARFDEANLGYLINFDGAIWGEGSTFFGTVFGMDSSFKHCQWGNNSRFDGSVWMGKANFEFASWGHSCSFIGATWGDFSKFDFAYWEFGVDFTDSTFGREANFYGAQFEGKCLFEKVKFGPDVSFRSAPVGIQSFYEIEHSDKSLKDINRTKNQNVMADFSFGGSAFNSVDFSGREFAGHTNFGYPSSRSGPKRISLKKDENNRLVFGRTGGLPEWEIECSTATHLTSFTSPPIFHDCKIGQGFYIHPDIKFPIIHSDGLRAASAYRTLKLAFSKLQAVHEEQKFFRLEMRHEASQEQGLKKSMYILYGEIADYGLSISRPIIFLIIFPIVLSLLFYAFLILIKQYFSNDYYHQIPASLWWSWLTWSFFSSIPIPGLDVGKEIRNSFVQPGTFFQFISVFWEAIQKLLAFIGFFLTGLAVRNLFKLK